MESFSAAVAVAPGGAEATVTVTGRMTIEHAADIKVSLLEALATTGKLVLDLRQVSEIDLIGLQFICALHRSASVEEKVVQVRGLHAPALQEVQKSAGFDRKGRCSGPGCASCVWLAEVTS